MNIYFLLIIGILSISLVSAVVKDYFIITCKDSGCSEGGICENDGYCHYSDGTKERKSCVELPELCREEDGKFCYTQRDYPVCIEVEEQEVVSRDSKKEIVGKKQISFSNDLVIGDTEIDSHKPEFVCNPQAENWNAPNPIGCWRTNVDYESSYTMYIGDKININSYLELTLTGMNAHYDYCSSEDFCTSGVEHGYSNNFNLNIRNFDFIQLEHKQDDKYLVEKDSNENLCFIIKNNLANFNSEQAGFYVILTKDLVVSEKRFFEPNNINRGSNNYCIPIDASMYGEIRYDIHSYFMFDDEILFDDDILIFRYKVVDKENMISEGQKDGTTYYTALDCRKDSDCNDFNSETEDRCVEWKCVNKKFLFYPFLIAAIIIIVLAMIFKKRR